MSLLFQVHNNRAVPNTETILIEPFKTIWERDTSKDKALALKELSICEFMASEKASNPFRGYAPDDKLPAILKQIPMEPDWELDLKCKLAIKVINDLQKEASSSFSYLKTARRAAEELKNFFLTFDMNERNERNGAPIFKPKDITTALKDTDDIVTNMMKLEKKVHEEIIEMVRTRGGNIISEFMK